MWTQNEDLRRERREAGRGRSTEDRQSAVGLQQLLQPKELMRGRGLEAQFPALLPSCWMTSGESLHLSGPQFLCL